MFEKFHRPLVDILQSYADIIVGMHFGHDHSDSFKVMTNSAGKESNLLDDLQRNSFEVVFRVIDKCC